MKGAFLFIFLSLFFIGAAPASAAGLSEDTFRGREWYLDKMQVPEAWTITTGTASVVVAVIDSGVDLDHPDLKDNIWTNPDEIAGNGKDDDGDGFVDDVHGWNFVNNTGYVRPDAAAKREAWVHGTAVASLIAAKADGFGMVGVSPNTKIMPLVAIGPDGYGRDQAISAAIRYAAAHGADIINLSVAGVEYDRGIEKAIAQVTAQGVLVVSAAGNSESLGGDDLDLAPGYPACDKGAGQRGELTVSGLNQQGQRADFADYGACVDVSAPSEDIFAAQPATNRVHEPTGAFVDGLSGTSLAVPLVSGVAALLKTKHPEWSGSELAKRIKATTDPFVNLPAALTGKLGTGSVNALRALAWDEAESALDTVQLQAAAPGNAPEIRLMDAQGKITRRFYVGAIGDRRGVRATFVRWSGVDKPEIAVTWAGAGSDSVNIYRDDGVLLAAGNVDVKPQGGLLMAAQDLDGDGRDTLLLAEAGGNRAWLMDPSDGIRRLDTFKGITTGGLLPFSLNRPVPAFLLSAKNGQLVILGDQGEVLAGSRLKYETPNTKSKKQNTKPQTQTDAWISRRVRSGTTQAFVTPGNELSLRTTAAGLRAADKPMPSIQTLEAPRGEPAGQGWMAYAIWPR